MIYEILAYCLITATLPGTLELLLVTLGYYLPLSKREKKGKKIGKTAVLIPAHNEEWHIGDTLASLKKNQALFETIVIADNCTDRTDRISTHMGARVLERKDPENRGKHHALRFAFQQLDQENFDHYIIVDADSYVDSNFVRSFQNCFSNGAEAVQALYTTEGTGSDFKARLMYLASVAFNYVRPRGRQGWGLSAGLFGNGVGLSKQLLEKVPFDGLSIVEDLEYHLKLVADGQKVTFNSETQVKAPPPIGREGAVTQRTRWEGGRIRLLLDQFPSLVRKIFKGNFALIEPLLDLTLLPLAYYTVLLFLLLLIPVCIGRSFALFAIAVLIFHVGTAFIAARGTWKDLQAILMAPLYVLWKLTFIGPLFQAVKNRIGWIRTDRTKK